MDYSKFLNKQSSKRRHSILREVNQVYVKMMSSGRPVITMAGGMPNETLFPVVEYTLKMRNGYTIHMDHSEMRKAQQYTGNKGLPSFKSLLMNLLTELHHPPTLNYSNQDAQFSILPTNGGQEAVCQIFESLANPEDSVLVQEPLSNDVISVIRPLVNNVVPVRSDEYGLIPEELFNMLSQVKDCKLLYCCPTANNPTGATLTLERRQKIYDIACDNNLIIIEHDPFYFLQTTKSYIPSFLSMDKDGRVLRVDSFSTSISPGMRLGVLSGPQFLVSKIEEHFSSSSMHVSSLTQVVTEKLFDKWKIEGFIHHCREIAQFYAAQREKCLAALRDNLKDLMDQIEMKNVFPRLRCQKVTNHISRKTIITHETREDLCEWYTTSNDGMFLWIKIIHKTRRDVQDQIIDGDIFTLGEHFMINKQDGVNFIRMCYANGSVESFRKETERLAKCLRHHVTTTQD